MPANIAIGLVVYTSGMPTSNLSRRHLMALGASAAFAQAPPFQLSRKLRLAIIGFDGHPGEIVDHLPALPGIEVAAIAEPDPEVTARVTRNPRLAAAKKYVDYREMLDREKLDLVAVCNNNGERAAAVISCLQRNLDVIAEKPLALTTADLDRIKRLVSEKKNHLGMLLPMRFSSPYLAIKKVVEAGLIGEVAQIGAQKSYQLGARPNWFFHKSTYGGTIPWIGIHMIDLMRWTSGREFREAASFQSRVAFPELGEMENVTASLFKLDNGGVATLRMDFLRPQTAPGHGDDRLRLAGTTGIVEYQADAGRVTVMTADKKPYAITSLPPAGSVFLDFLDAAYNGHPASLTRADIFRVNEITIAAQEAAERHQLISIPG